MKIKDVRCYYLKSVEVVDLFNVEVGTSEVELSIRLGSQVVELG